MDFLISWNGPKPRHPYDRSAGVRYPRWPQPRARILLLIHRCCSAAHANVLNAVKRMSAQACARDNSRLKPVTEDGCERSETRVAHHK